MTDLRPYQLEVVEQLGRIDERRVIVVAPTGSGKTIIAAEIIRRAVASGQRVLVLAHRVEIIKQTSEKLFAHGIQSGIIQAGFATRPDEPVQVASIQTLWMRAVKMRKMELPQADLLIIDECHHAPAQTYQKIIDAYPNAVLIGLTATPCRGDGRGTRWNIPSDHRMPTSRGPDRPAILGQDHRLCAGHSTGPKGRQDGSR